MRPSELLRSIGSNSQVRWILRLCALAVLCCGLPQVARAQQGTILGTVTDQSGGVVPSATVTITNTDTGLVTTETTGKEGDYVAPLLIIGHYSIEVKAQGFKASKQTINLEVGDRRRIDFKLETGVITEQMTITANAIAVQADSNDISSVITGQQLKALEIGSQSYFNLIDLVPGASPNNADIQFPSANTGDSSISFNGQRSAHQLNLIDGGENSDRGGQGPQVMPSEQAISEVRVMTSNYDAQYGLESGETSTMVIQSGTSQFHASGWEWDRNNALTARNFFNPAGAASELRYNVFGFNVGGPVEFTSKHPKTFFFYNMEWRRQVTGAGGNLMVPYTQQYPQGGITGTGPAVLTPPGSDPQLNMQLGQLQTPYNCQVSAAVAAQFAAATPAVALSQCGPGNTTSNTPCSTTVTTDCYNQFPVNGTGQTYIPGSLISQNARALIYDGMFPAPTGAAGVNPDIFVGNAKAPTMLREEIIRLDHRFNDHWQIFGHWIEESFQQTDVPSRWDWATLPSASDTFANPGRHAVIHLTDTISPTLLNEIAFNYGDNPISILPFAATPFVNNTDAVAGSGFSENAYFANRGPTLPQVNVGGNINDRFETNWWPWINTAESYEARDDLSWTHGAHQIKAGFAWYKFAKAQDLQTTPQGDFEFSGNFTGFAYADFLLGLASSYSEAALKDERQWNSVSWGVYLEDDWRATKRLTLNLGLRWDGMPHTAEINDQMANFYPASYNSSGWATAQAAGAGFVPNVYNTPASGYNYNLICGPANVYNATSNPTGTCSAANPFLGTGPNPALNGLLQYDNGIGVAGVTPGVTGALVPNFWDTYGPRVGFAYDLTGNGKTILRAGFGIFYERVQGNDMYQINMNLFGGSSSVNNVSLQNPHTLIGPGGGSITTTSLPITVNGLYGLNGLDYKTPTSYQYSMSVQQQVGSQTVVTVAYVGNAGRHESEQSGINNPPIADLPSMFNASGGTSGALLQTNQVVPYAGYGGLALASDDARSQYNSLQISVRSQFRNLTVNSAYTFARAYDATSNSQDGGDLSTNSNPYLGWIDQYGPAAINRDNIFFVDFVYTFPTLAGHNLALKEVAGGWQLAGIVTAEGGVPLNVGTAANNVCAVVPSNCSVRPNVTGLITYPKTQTVDPTSGLGTVQWFSPSAFSNNWLGGTLGANTVATFGDLGYNGIWGPGRQNWDLSVIKDFAFTERLKLELRGDAVNAWNHPQWNGVNTTIGQQNTGMVTGAYEGRTLQVGAKITF
jgi:hypothetical protein